MSEKALGADAAAVDKAGAIVPTDSASHVAPEIVTVELDPAIWYRGDHANSYLLDAHSGQRRSQCCLGVACTALGVPDGDVRGKGCLRDVPYLPAVLVRISMGSLAGRLYGINDTKEIASDTARVSQLNETLLAHNVPLRFRLKVETGTQAALTEIGSVPSAAPKDAKAEGR